MGYDGCGCAAVCQPFYQTLDLEKYGARVRRYGDLVVIGAGIAGADLIPANQLPEGWRGEYFVSPGGIAWVVRQVDDQLVSVAVPVTPEDLRKRGEIDNGQTRAIPATKRNYEPGTRKARGKRSGLVLDTRRRPPDIRRIAGEKTISVRVPEPSNPRLFDFGSN
jgi:hypothetical protein